MTSTFVNDLRLNEMGTGDQSGTWGNVTNTNLELIAEALGFGTEAITTNADTHTTTIADGATDPGRAIYIKYTGTLDSACTITIGPNTISRLHIIENATSGSQNIIISQGSGSSVTIGNGAVKAVYLDGAGSGAAVNDALVDLDLTGTTTVAALTSSGTISAGSLDLNGGELILDADADTSITSDTDDQIDFKTGGTDVMALSTTGLTVNGTITADDITLSDADTPTITLTDTTNTLTTVLQSGNSTAVLGTTTNHDLRLFTNNTEALRIDADGNVGIGDSSPESNTNYKALTVTSTSGNGGGQVYVQSSSVNSVFGADNTSDPKSILQTVTNHPLILGTNNTERMRIDTSGNVGIGTTSPDTIIHGLHATAPVLKLERDSTSLANNNIIGEIRMSHKDSNDAGDAIRIIGRAEGTAGAAGLAFTTGTPSGGSEAMRIDSSGNVGIGTTSPSGVLDVRNGTTQQVIIGNSGSYTGSEYGELLFKESSTELARVKWNPSGNTFQIINRIAGPLTFSTSDTEQMRIDSSGNVGIGATPSTKFHVKVGTNQNFNVFAPGVGTTGVTLGATTDGFGAFAEMEQRATQFVFHNGTTERMRISSDGRLLVARTTDNHGGMFCLNYTGGSTAGLVITDTTTSGTGVAMQIVNGSNTIVGSISHNQSSTSFNTSSDHRLKENVVTDWDATSRLKQLKPSRFNFKADKDITVDGFLAHEVSSIVPEAISGEKDAVDADGNIEPQSIDQSKLVPLLTKALQEALARIDTLEAEVKTLKGE